LRTILLLLYLGQWYERRERWKYNNSGIKSGLKCKGIEGKMIKAGTNDEWVEGSMKEDREESGCGEDSSFISEID